MTSISLPVDCHVTSHVVLLPVALPRDAVKVEALTFKTSDTQQWHTCLQIFYYCKVFYYLFLSCILQLVWEKLHLLGLLAVVSLNKLGRELYN